MVNKKYWKLIVPMVLAVNLLLPMTVGAEEIKGDVDVAVEETAPVTEPIYEVASTYYGEDFTEGNFKYTVSGGKATIKGLIDGSVSTVVVPATIGGYPVTDLGFGAFAENANIRSVVLNEGLETIDMNCFANCVNLTGELAIPSTVKVVSSCAFEATAITSLTFRNGLNDLKICDSAFHNCESLTQISFNANLKTIDNNAFDGCSKVQTITFPNDCILESINGLAFRNNDLSSVVLPGKVKTIGGKAFEGNNNLQSVILNEGLETIENSCFEGCKKLTGELVIPSTVKTVNESAFKDTGVASLTFKNGSNELTIYDSAFENCIALKQIAFNTNVKSIGYGAFKECSQLQAITFPTDAVLQKICRYAFSKTGLTSVTLPKNVQVMESYAFAENQNLQTVVLNEGLKTIDNNCFWNCANLTGEVMIPFTVELVGAGAFEKTGIKGLTILNSNIKIDYNAFSDCTALEWVQFGRRSDEGKLEIGDNTFTNDTALKSISLPGNIKSIGGDAFNDSGLTDIYFAGNASDYSGMSINTDWNKNYNSATKHYNQLVFHGSMEKIQGFVTRMYTTALARGASDADVCYWITNLLSKQNTGSQACETFLLGGEITNANIPDSEFVTRCYRTLFNREPDAGGYAHWMQLLDESLSRRYVMAGFCSGPEFANLCNQYGIAAGSVTLFSQAEQNENVTRFVNRCYTVTLGRKPALAEVEYWTGLILNKAISPKDVAVNFVMSQEVANKNLSNGDFVAILYRTYMGREYDAGGYNYWVGLLSQGVTRQAACDNFGGSQEFANILASFGLN